MCEYNCQDIRDQANATPEEVKRFWVPGEEGFDIEEKLGYMIDELASNPDYSNNRFAQEYESEIVTYVKDLERDYEALRILFSRQVDIIQGRNLE